MILVIGLVGIAWAVVPGILDWLGHYYKPNMDVYKEYVNLQLKKRYKSYC